MLMKERIELGSGVVIYFSNANQGFLPSEEEIVDQLSLQVIEVFTDGTIYGIMEGGHSP